MASSRLPTTSDRSQLMGRVRRSDTAAELLVRQVMRELGVRFQVNPLGLPGTPDIANKCLKWAIFVHGCFWHAHIHCRRWRIPKNNRDFWTRKFIENKIRDKRKIDLLLQLGYSVLLVWECELENVQKLRERINAFLEGGIQPRPSGYYFVRGEKSVFENKKTS